MASQHSLLTKQVMAAMIVHHPFTHPPSPLFPGFTTSSIVQILSSIPSFLFLSPRSVGRQRPTSRHRSPLRPRHSSLLLGPAAHRLHSRLRHAVSSALLFFSFSQSLCRFTHTPLTAGAMARLLARANALPPLWHFLRQNAPLITTATLTDVIKTLGEEGLTSACLSAFYRMKQLHCKPDAQCYNTTIAALCSAGEFKKARFLLAQMEFPGARVPPDAYTYTIFIASYCKRSLQTGCRKAVRRRIWEANHMFRHMLFKGFQADIVTYNCLIDGLCKTYRIGRAHELFDEMILKGCLPNRVTYNSFVRYYSVVNEVNRAIEMMRLMVSRGHGVATSSTYTPIVHSLCEAGRVREARDFLVEMVESGSVPREYTYKLVCDALRSAGEEGLPLGLHRRIESGIDDRYRQVMQLKPMMRERKGLIQEQLHAADG